jgi:CubicO group peptidase (beta-lactamase class C family)
VNYLFFALPLRELFFIRVYSRAFAVTFAPLRLCVRFLFRKSIVDSPYKLSPNDRLFAMRPLSHLSSVICHLSCAPLGYWLSATGYASAPFVICHLSFVIISTAAAATPPDIALQQQMPAVESIIHDAMNRYGLKAIIAAVNSGGQNIYTEAVGESMTGASATAPMHFRNGAMAFTYLSTMLLELVDQKKVSLDTKLSEFLPDLPNADRITLKNLANMTSGYADYVYQPEVTHALNLDPFRQWSSDELIRIGTSKPMMFEPGTNWGYSHTNYVILGRVLEMVTGLPLAVAMQKYIFGPMDLKQTQGADTPEIPSPVLHTYSSERRTELGVPASSILYEESTFWNPSWTTAEGAVQTTDINDFAKSMEAVGTGKLLSKESSAAQINPNLVGFGHPDPNCPACHQNTKERNYGLGVVILGSWITQTKNFAGCGATVGYLPAKKLTVAIVTTYSQSAFDEDGDYKNASDTIFESIVNVLAPNTNKE